MNHIFDMGYRDAISKLPRGTSLRKKYPYGCHKSKSMAYHDSYEAGRIDRRAEAIANGKPEHVA